MAQERDMTGAEQAKQLYEESENRTARAFEELVARESFGELLARTTENVVAITKIGTDVFDLVLRNLRLAGRQDVTRLARQLARAEDKLELVLQEVERLHDRLDERERSVGARRDSGNGRPEQEVSGAGSAPASGGGEDAP